MKINRKHENGNGNDARACECDKVGDAGCSGKSVALMQRSDTNVTDETGRRRAPLRGRMAVTMGTGALTQDSILRPAPRLTNVHLFRLDPQTTSEYVYKYVRETLGIDKVECEKLSSRNQETYASFRIIADRCDEAKLLDPKSWPLGACIKRFFVRGNVGRTKR